MAGHHGVALWCTLWRLAMHKPVGLLSLAFPSTTLPIINSGSFFLPSMCETVPSPVTSSQVAPASDARRADHRLEDIIALFDGLFADTFNTRLERGGDEPLYLPADTNCAWHRVIFARGFYTSALHEISHWCIAGERRRLLEDYGYWYIPDGRDSQQQHAFEKVEIAPQALELLLSRAGGVRFHVSVDNLGDAEVDREAFEARVSERAEHYVSEGLPLRAAALERALFEFYHRGVALSDAVRAGQERLTTGRAKASRGTPQPA